MTKHPHFTRWPVVEGFVDHGSYRAGEVISVRCSGRSSNVGVEVTRVGATRETVWRRSGIKTSEQPVAEDAYAIGCDWPVTFTIQTSSAWLPGFYEVALIDLDSGGGDDRARSEAWFVLRSADPRLNPDRMLVVLATNTWNAYNQWGGACLYSGASRMSFRRPIERGFIRRHVEDDGFDGRVASVGSEPDPEHLRLQDYQRRGRYPLWSASSGWFNRERRFVAWAERQGHQLDFAIDADLDPTFDNGSGDDRPAPVAEIMDGRRLVVTVGHSEYWSAGMRDTMDGHVQSGENWAILSGNTCFWQIRYTPDGAMVCHKGNARTDDPVMDTNDLSTLTSAWSDPLIGLPENTTIGLSFTRGGYHRMGHAVSMGTGGYMVARPDHWALAGTGLAWGDQLGSDSFAVGYEVDGCTFTTIDGLPVPTGEDQTPESFEIVATAPARLISINAEVCEAPEALWASVDPPGDLEAVSTMLGGDDPTAIERFSRGHAVMGSFSPGGGAGTVFNAGSADWCYGLDNDPLIQQTTANIIDRLSRAST